jgi:hypothetical protein
VERVYERPRRGSAQLDPRLDVLAQEVCEHVFDGDACGCGQRRQVGLESLQLLVPVEHTVTAIAVHGPSIVQDRLRGIACFPQVTGLKG